MIKIVAYFTVLDGTEVWRKLLILVCSPNISSNAKSTKGIKRIFPTVAIALPVNAQCGHIYVEKRVSADRSYCSGTRYCIAKMAEKTQLPPYAKSPPKDSVCKTVTTTAL